MPKAPTQLVVYGPFDIPYVSQGPGTSKRFDDEHVDAFWESHGVASVSSKQGCYVFALSSSGGYNPWYVGKTSRSFKQEAFHSDKVKRYNSVVYKGTKGKPVMFFVAKAGGANKIPKKQLDDLETFLIQSAIYKNPFLRNKHKTATPPWGIGGVVRSGRGKVAANARKFKTMMNIG